MGSDPSLYPQSPQSVGRVLDAGFGIFRAGFMAVLPVSVAISLLINLPQLAELMPNGSVWSGKGSLLGAALLIAGLVLYLSGYMGMLAALDAVGRGQRVPGFVESFSLGLGRLGPALGGMILYALVIALGLLLLVLPGLVLMFTLSFVLPCVMLENRGAVESLKASHAMVWGHWGRTAAVLTVAGLIYYIPSILITGVLGFAIASAEVSGASGGVPQFGGIYLLVFVLVQAVIAGLLLPLLNAIMLAQFNDLRLRRSGSDLLARASG